jgi:hypothetical protein
MVQNHVKKYSVDFITKKYVKMKSLLHLSYWQRWKDLMEQARTGL